MKQKRLWFVLCAAMGAAFLLLGCPQQTVEKVVEKPIEKIVEKEVDRTPPADTTAPAVATNVAAQNRSNGILLTWTDPNDEDLYGIEISWTPYSAPRAITAPAAGTLTIAKGTGVCLVSGLTQGTNYTFTLKAVDTSGNRSAGVEKEHTFEAIPSAVSLTASPTDATEGAVTIALTKTSAVSGLAEAKYLSGLKTSLVEGRSGTDITLSDNSGSFNVSANGTYTLYVKDSQGNESLEYITVGNIKPVGSLTPPAAVGSLTTTDRYSGILLTWTDPADTDLATIEITWTGTPAGSLSVPKGTQSAMVSGLVLNNAYTFTLKAVDTSGNRSAGVPKTHTWTYDTSSPLSIALTQTPTEPTNGTVAVNAAITTSETVTNVKWTSGVQTSSWFASNGTVLAAGNSPSFTVTANGTYSLYARDSVGRQEVSSITISNIDKTATEPVANLSGWYNQPDSKITLNWTDPGDADLKEIELVWKKGSESPTTVSVARGVKTWALGSVTADNATYSFTLTAIDNAGNRSVVRTISVQAVTAPSIGLISLSRNHLDTVMADRTINVSISGYNFNLLNETNGLRVQVFEGSNGQTAVPATVDTGANTATATVTAPIPGSPTAAGTTYTVKAIIKDSGSNTTTSPITASFIVSLPATVSSISLAQTQVPEGNTGTIRASITGTNFDIRGTTQVKLLDSDNNVVGTSMVDIAENLGTATAFDADIPVPSISGVYTVAVFFNGAKQLKTTTFQVYGTPQITAVHIPTAGVSYAGSALPVTITGKNFTAPGITASSFSGLSNVVIKSDTLATATVACLYDEGTSTLTVTCGSASGSGTIKVVAAADCFVVGDFVLKDGSRVAKGTTLNETQKANTIAVIITAPYGGGTGLGVGLKQSTSLAWAPSGSTGYNTNFTAIRSTLSGTAPNYTFTGDLDGSDNWAAVCAVDPAGTANAATNYPAFNFAQNYGTATAGANLEASHAFAADWYLPALAELYEVYKNKELINTSMAAAGGTSFGSGNFWSSSQIPGNDNYAWDVYFGGGSANKNGKNLSLGVCVLRAFNAP